MSEIVDRRDRLTHQPYSLEHEIIDRLRKNSGKDGNDYANVRLIEDALRWVIKQIEEVEKDEERKELQGLIFTP